MSKQIATHSAKFSKILEIIHVGRARAYQSINVALIDTYWAVGEHLSRKVSEAGWGRGTVQELAVWLLAKAPEVKVSLLRIFGE